MTGEKKKLAHNALANILQTLIGTGLLFALYRYINTTLGVEQLGVWSVVLATVSASRLANMGLSAGVIRFVARDQAHGDLKRAGQVIDTAVLTLMVAVGAVLLLLYPLFVKVLPHLFENAYLGLALAILPYALISLWLTMVATAFQGGIDGCQRMDMRAGLMMVGQILLLVLAVLFVPQYGLVGLAWAQIGQGLFLVVAGRLMLCRVLPALPKLPRYWSRPVLWEILGYGANVQAATLFMLLLDPISKAFMVHFGGPAAAGYFEMAHQVVVKVQSVIVTANRAIVPYVAALVETDPYHLNRLYKQNICVLVFVALPTFALLFAWAGGFSWLLAGEYQPELVFLIGLLIAARVINTFASPAYLINMGTGHVGWNTYSHAIMGVINVGLGWLLGIAYNGSGVACAYVIAMVAGDIFLLTVFQCRNHLRHVWFNREHLALVIACIIVIVFGWMFPMRPFISQPAVFAAILTLPPFILGLAVWFHPMRRQLLGWFMARGVRT